MIPRSLHRALLNLPVRWAKHYEAYCNWRWSDPTLRVLPSLCSKKKVSIDIGANKGAFTYFLAWHSASCVAFEPNPRLAELLREKRFLRTTIVETALSDQSGTAELRIPRWHNIADPGRASIETKNEFEPVEGYTVNVRPLDDFGFRNIGFIKIDVEGHEASVLRGACQTIRQSLPILMLELEDQHRPGVFDECLEILRTFNYEGAFVLEDSLKPLPDFERRIHQSEQRLGQTDYVANFVFRPR